MFIQTKKAKERNEECSTIITSIPKDNININNIELNILYNIAGYIIFSIMKCNRICGQCIDSVGSKQFDPNQKYTELVQLRCFWKNTLFFVNDSTFTYFNDMEIVIRQYISHIKNNNCNFLDFYTYKMKDISCTTIKNCHKLQETIMKRFIIHI